MGRSIKQDKEKLHPHIHNYLTACPSELEALVYTEALKIWRSFSTAILFIYFCKIQLNRSVILSFPISGPPQYNIIILTFFPQLPPHAVRRRRPRHGTVMMSRRSILFSHLSALVIVQWSLGGDVGGVQAMLLLSHTRRHHDNVPVPHRLQATSPSTMMMAVSPSSSSSSSSYSSSSREESRRAQVIRKNRIHRRNPPQVKDGKEERDDSEESSVAAIATATAASPSSPAPRSSSRPSNSSQQIRQKTNQRKLRSSRLPPMSTNGMSIPYEVTLEALKVFHQQHGHVVLPRRFLIPANDNDDSNDGNNNAKSLSFYPVPCHGIDLATTVYNMEWWLRHVRSRPDRVADLNRLGFVWERLQPEWNLIVEALIVYRTLFGNLLVRSTFCVPYNDEKWPKACWGLALGNSVYKIRNRGDHLRGPNAWKRREQLDAIGFCWDVQEGRFEKFCHALRIYSQIHHFGYDSHGGRGGGAAGTFVTSIAGTAASTPMVPLRIPSRFRIPRSSRWPNTLWGYPLGDKCTQVRQKELYIKNHPRRKQTLVELGFFVGGNAGLSWLQVVHAAAVYSQMHQNVLDVPTGFVVPYPPRKLRRRGGSGAMAEENTGSDDAWPWPEYLWGFPLGQRLRDVRVKGYHMNGDDCETRRRQLDALGMVWTPRQGRPPRDTSQSKKVANDSKRIAG